MRDPCPYCRLPRVALSRRDAFTNHVVRDIREHDCPTFSMPPRLTGERTDTSFIREARNRPEALAAWRAAERPRGDDRAVTCGTCRTQVGIGYEDWRRHLIECPPTVEVRP